MVRAGERVLKEGLRGGIRTVVVVAVFWVRFSCARGGSGSGGILTRIGLVDRLNTVLIFAVSAMVEDVTPFGKFADRGGGRRLTLNILRSDEVVVMTSQRKWGLPCQVCSRASTSEQV